MLEARCGDSGQGVGWIGGWGGWTWGSGAAGGAEGFGFEDHAALEEFALVDAEDVLKVFADGHEDEGGFGGEEDAEV